MFDNDVQSPEELREVDLGEVEDKKVDGQVNIEDATYTSTGATVSENEDKDDTVVATGYLETNDGNVPVVEMYPDSEDGTFEEGGTYDVNNATLREWNEEAPNAHEGETGDYNQVAVTYWDMEYDDTDVNEK